MVLIGGRPILWHIMKTYATYGFNDFVICLGYKGNMIKEYFLNYEAMNNDFTIELGSQKKIKLYGNGDSQEKGWSVTLVNTGEEAQTGARVKRVERYLDDDTFMLTYGDGVANVNIKDLVKYHEGHDMIGTMTGVRPASRFGELVLDKKNRVKEFKEKPLVTEGFINGGYFVFNRQFFDYLSDDDGCFMEREPLNDLVADGQLVVYPHDGFWQCMDTYRESEMLNTMWRSNSAPWRVW